MNNTFGSTDYLLLSGSSYIMDLSVMLVLQRETRKNESGFVPYLGVGGGFSYGSVDYGFISGNGFGWNFIAETGVKYNFKKAYIGIGMSYTLSLINTPDIEIMRNRYSSTIIEQLNPSAIRVFAETGFRF